MHSVCKSFLEISSHRVDGPILDTPGLENVDKYNNKICMGTCGKAIPTESVFATILRFTVAEGMSCNLLNEAMFPSVNDKSPIYRFE